MKNIKLIIKILFSIIFFLFILIVIIGGGFGTKIHPQLSDKGNSIIFAHRGMAKYYVENSLEGFVESKKVGFTAVEIDVKLTKDKRLVVFHDESCKRLLGIDKNISATNFRDIQDLYLMHENQKTSNKILLLDVFFKIFQDSFVVYLDVKKSSVTVADTLLEYIKKYDLYNTVLIADERFLFLAYLKFKDSKIKIILEEFNSDDKWKYYLIPKNFKPNYYSSSIHQTTQKDIDFLKINNLVDKQIIYDITHENIQGVFEKGFRNIILDYDHSLDSLLTKK